MQWPSSQTPPYPLYIYIYIYTLLTTACPAKPVNHRQPLSQSSPSTETGGGWRSGSEGRGDLPGWLAETTTDLFKEVGNTTRASGALNTDRSCAVSGKRFADLPLFSSFMSLNNLRWGGGGGGRESGLHEKLTGMLKWGENIQWKTIHWELSQVEMTVSKQWSLGEWHWGEGRWGERGIKREKKEGEGAGRAEWDGGCDERCWLQISRGISRLLPATGWSHTEEMKERAGRQRSHIPLFSTQSHVPSSCVFTPLSEGIKVNMLAYPQPPPAPAGLSLHLSLPPPLSFHPSLLLSHHPPFLSSRSIAVVIWESLVWPRNMTAQQICSVSLCISYLLCLTRRDKTVLLPSLTSDTNPHTNLKLSISSRVM